MDRSMLPRTRHIVCIPSRIVFEHELERGRGLVNKSGSRRCKNTSWSYESLKRKGCDHRVVLDNDTHFLDLGVLFSFSCFSTKKTDGFIKRSFVNHGFTIFFHARSLELAFRSRHRVINGNQELHHRTIKDAVGTGSVGNILQVAFDMLESMPFF